MKKKTYRRLTTSLVLFILLVLSMVYVFYRQDSGAWFTQTAVAAVNYDMGVVRLAGSEGWATSINNFTFPASTLLRGTGEDDAQFNKYVLVSTVTVENVSNVPVIITAAVENIADIVDGTSVTRQNPGLVYALSYHKGSVDAEHPLIKDPVSYFKAGDGSLKPEMKPCFISEQGDGSHRISCMENTTLTPKFPIEINGKESYTFYWAFWIDHKEALAAKPELQKLLGRLEGKKVYDTADSQYVALNDQYGVTISIIARQNVKPLDQSMPTP